MPSTRPGFTITWSAGETLQDCEADIGARGKLVRTYRGSRAKNPSIQIARQYREHLLSWSKEFGFTIGSRSRLAVPEPARPKVNKFAELDLELDR